MNTYFKHLKAAIDRIIEGSGALTTLIEDFFLNTISDLLVYVIRLLNALSFGIIRGINILHVMTFFYIIIIALSWSFFSGFFAVGFALLFLLMLIPILCMYSEARDKLLPSFFHLHNDLSYLSYALIFLGVLDFFKLI